MAIALVSSVSAAPGGGGGATAAINTTGATLLVVSVSAYQNTPTTVTDSKGNSYLALTHHAAGAAAHRLFYCVGGTVGTGHTFTAAGAATYPAIFAYAFSGANIYDRESGTTLSSGTSIASGSVTPASNGALIFSGVCGQNAVTDAITPAGFTVTSRAFAGGTNMQGSAAWQVQATAAAINPTWGFTPSQGNSACSTAVFVEGVAAPTAIRVTQATTEALTSPTVPSIAVTQWAIEVLGSLVPVSLPTAIEITQDTVEMLLAAPVATEVTQYVVEALGGPPVPLPAGDYTWQIKDLTDVDRWMTGLLVFPEGDLDPPAGPGGVGAQVFIPMHVTTRVVFPVGTAGWGGVCLCDE